MNSNVNSDGNHSTNKACAFQKTNPPKYEMNFFKKNYNLEFECKGYLIFPVLARFWVYCQIINTNNSKE